ncbi:hypothetical protein VNF293_29420 [Atlantibacter hermannii]
MQTKLANKKGILKQNRVSGGGKGGGEYNTGEPDFTAQAVCANTRPEPGKVLQHHTYDFDIA